MINLTLNSLSMAHIKCANIYLGKHRKDIPGYRATSDQTTGIKLQKRERTTHLISQSENQEKQMVEK